MTLPMLPNEIWQKIFQSLQRHEIYVCVFVCKNWQAPAIQVYYEEILIKESRMKYVQSKLQQLLQQEPTKQQFSHGQWTKKLIITVDSETYGFFNEGSNSNSKNQEEYEKEENKLKADHFLLLLSLLPNLKTINLSFSAYHNYYMAILRDAASPDILQRIEEITNLTYHKPYQELHFSACYNFRQTITRLVVFPNDYLINGVQHNFLHYLPQFSQLTHLSIYNDREKDLTIFDILQTCPNLISLKYTSYFPVPDRAKFLFEGMTANLLSPTATATTTAAETGSLLYNCNKRLQVLDLNVPALTEPYVLYITHYTPLNLNNVTIHIQGADFHNWIHNPLVLQLAHRLSTVKNLQIHASPEISPHTLLETRMNRFYKFIIALEGQRNLYCEATFSKSRSSETMIEIQDNSYMTFTCGIVDNGQISLVGVDIESIKGPEIIHSLKFMIFQRDKSIPEKILKYAHKSCPRLRLLNIDCIYPYYNLKVWAPACEEDDGELHDEEGKRRKYGDKRKWFLLSPPKANTRLTHLCLEDLTLSQDLLDELSGYLPAIEMIKCFGPLGCTKDDANVLCNGSSLNLTVFQHLKSFYFDVRNIKMMKYDYVFIQFDIVDTSTSWCYRLTTKQDPEEDEQEYSVTLTTMAFMLGCCGESLLRTSVINFEFSKSTQVTLCVDDQFLAEIRYDGHETPAGFRSLPLTN